MMGMTRWRAALRRVWVTFDGAGGTASVAAMRTGLDGKLATLPTATRDNYELAGWFLADGTQVTTETVFTADTTVTARWTANTVTVTVTLDNGTAKAVTKVAINDEFLPDDDSLVLDVAPGSIIFCQARGRSSGDGSVVLNGTTVAKSSSYAKYNYTVKASTPVTIVRGHRTVDRVNIGKISITEEGS